MNILMSRSKVRFLIRKMYIELPTRENGLSKFLVFFGSHTFRVKKIHKKKSVIFVELRYKIEAL